MLKDKLWLPPAFRFITELTTWIWLLIYKWPLIFLSIPLLSMLNYPGDKKPAEQGVIGLAVSGWIRISVEVFSAILGIIAAFMVFNMIGLIFQTIITIFSFFLDKDRWLWMFGKKDIPNFVTYVYKS